MSHIQFVLHPWINPNTIEKRAYQDSVVKTAISGNTLVVLPTGLGKTSVAALVAAHRLEKDMHKKIMFLAPTKPLVSQHKKSFERFLKIGPDELKVVTGGDSPDIRAKLYSEADIVFATPQTIANDLKNNRITFRDFSLLIVDECHRCVKNYAYTYVAKEYMKQSNDPLILGLTASPGACKTKIDEIKKNMFIEKVEIRDREDNEVSPYVQRLVQSFVQVDLSKELRTVSNLLSGYRNEILEKLMSWRFVFNPRITKVDLLKLQAELIRRKTGASLAALSCVAEMLKIDHAIILAETQTVYALKKYLDNLGQEKSMAARRFAKTLAFQESYNIVTMLSEKEIEHPKIGKLIHMVGDEIAKGKRIIVFAQYRDTIDKIISVLKTIKEAKPVGFIGQAKKSGKGMSQKEQVQTINEFKLGFHNILCCTSVHPDEFIILKNPEDCLKIEKIGNFVDKILQKTKNKSCAKTHGWKAMSTDGKKIGFYPVTMVHKHKRKSKVLSIKLGSGFESIITEDHSIFTFNRDGKLAPDKAKQNIFVSIGCSIPKIRVKRIIDIVKELIENAPKETIKRLYCSFDNLSQAKIRMMKSDYKTIAVLSNKEVNKTQLEKTTKLGYNTIGDVLDRLKKHGCVKTVKEGNKLLCRITNHGMTYKNFLEWFFKKQYYWKKKYRAHLVDIASAPKGIEYFCKLNVEVLYGKTKIPRYIKMSNALAELSGLYVSEGHAQKDKKKSVIFLAARIPEMQKRMRNSIKNSISIQPNTCWRGVSLDSQIGYYLIKYVLRCGIGAYNKEIPDIIFSAPKEQKWKFLEAYCAGDGHITKDMIVLTTVSRKLAAGLIVLLRQLGIRKVTIRKDSCYRITIYESLPFAKLNKKTGNPKCYYDLMPTALKSNQAYDLFANRYVPKSKTYLRSRTSDKSNKELRFDYIKKIETLKKQPKYVYDISVKNTNKFFGGTGLICLHNSIGEEGLDIAETDTVIFYEPIPSEIRKIQRTGRTARTRQGKVITLITKNTKDEAFYWSSYHKENKMKKILHEMQNKNTLNAFVK